jgi:hypothetical protein
VINNGKLYISIIRRSRRPIDTSHPTLGQRYIILIPKEHATVFPHVLIVFRYVPTLEAWIASADNDYLVVIAGLIRHLGDDELFIVPEPILEGL